jgi:hypothetical protein
MSAYVIRVCYVGSSKNLKDLTGACWLDVIRKEAWPFYRTISDVRRCWQLEKSKGPRQECAPGSTSDPPVPLRGLAGGTALLRSTLRTPR